MESFDEATGPLEAYRKAEAEIAGKSNEAEDEKVPIKSSPPGMAQNGDASDSGLGSPGSPVKDATMPNGGDLKQPKSQNATPINPSFPQLSYNPPHSPEVATKEKDKDGEDEEPNIAQSFDRSSSPTSLMHRNRGAVYEKVGEDGVARMHRYSLYETATRYYMVGGDLMDQRFRILKIDRTAESGDLSIAEDDIVYTKKEMNQLLNTVDDGNKSSGGMKLRCSTWGILGFIRFTGAYYMLVITRRSQVAMIGGHYIYQVDATDLVPLTTASSSRFRSDKNPEEARFISILHNLDLSRSFYFSYSYDITRTLQHNISRERWALEKGERHPAYHDANDMFAWNTHLLQPARHALKSFNDWSLPIIHGYVDQANLSVYGRTVYITIIARRSRFFAGARFLKRGANDLGYVANDVETEQIVSEMLTTSFHAPGPKLYANPNYTSYVQHRGSIPLYWTQDNTGVSPKPDIELNLVDPFYEAAALHFDNLFERYGAPVYVLNLIKARERLPRESKLLHEYENAINYLNQSLPQDKKIKYKAWDMSRASKTRDQDVIGTLESIAEGIIPTTGFFRNGDNEGDGLRLQNGVARTNCIDCLDRTNAAQFVIGKRALGHQLHALGVIEGTYIDYDSDAVNLFTHMWHDHGDTIAVQYGGSHLVNTMETYRKINQWTSHSRDMVESFKRYYNNSFLDAQRQEAYNLFLGNYIFAQGQPMLWDLSTDYYLHHADPRTWSNKNRNSYINWFTPKFLERRECPPDTTLNETLIDTKPLKYFDDYWLEYYRPLLNSAFSKIFASKMNSTLRYIPFKDNHGERYDLSPFKIRKPHEHEAGDKRGVRKKGVKIIEPPTDDNQSEDTQSVSSRQNDPINPPSKPKALKDWVLEQQSRDKLPPPGIMKDTASPLERRTPNNASSTTTPATPSSKALLNQQTLSQLVTSSLNPSVNLAEMSEYERYVSHPLNLPLVVSSTVPSSQASYFYEYVNKSAVEDASMAAIADESMADYEEFVAVGDEPLRVVEGDWGKKRYKRYGQWLRGKSLFKQREG